MMVPTLRRTGLRGGWDEPTFEPLNRIERMLGDYGGTFSFAYHFPVNIWEDDEYVHVEADLPGFSKNEVDVRIENGILTIEAQREQKPQEDDSSNYHLHERQYSHLRRSFTMPTSVNASDVDAWLEDGVLRLKLHKAEEVRPRRIPLR